MEYQKIVNQLKELAMSTEDKNLRSTLEESVHRVRMCILECEYAAKQL
ncbi:hypothetical protein [Dethiobacter alkaliphilus]|nr:hypothetical protein [Dethiobacter alkaliphilus]MCW3490935.1 hypothetical protein [Dethiobacter alkaliphilus]